MTTFINSMIPEGNSLHGKVYPIGHKFTWRQGRASPRECEIINYRLTLDGSGQFVSLRYVVKYDFMGQQMTAADVVQTTIQRNSI